MMKKLFYSLMGLLLFGISLVAQESKRWTIGLSFEYGLLTHKPIKPKHPQGYLIVPSLRYNFDNNWSIGLNVLLPLKNTTKYTSLASFYKVVEGFHYTTGGELFATKSIEPIRRLRISLSAVTLLGITGNYKQIKFPIGVYGSNSSSGQSNSDIEGSRVVHKYWRWAVGLRPKISYQFSPTWGIELGYGFWGYRSQKDMVHDSYYNRYYYKGKKESTPTSGAWGFNRQVGWGNGLKVGLTWSF